MSFNDSQKRAIAICDGPAMILAGAGSGKTTVITHRIQSLITEHNIDPASILVITFTKAAANEMKERFLNMMDETNTKVTFGTFHAIFFMVLKIVYKMDVKNILLDDVKYQLLRSLIQKYRLDIRDENEVCISLANEISIIKNGRMKVEHYYSSICGESVFRDIFREYNQYLKNNRLIDFDDMMLYTYDLFSRRPDILNHWQKKYKYILIDEFQDINQLQFDIIKMIALPENNIFIVGDDDQSIYRFRGSKPEIMMQFPKVYPECEQILLDVNYRCDATICEKAMNLISHNKIRFVKNINSIGEKNDCFRIHYFESEKEENEYIAEFIKTAEKNGTSLSDFAVLYRTNKGPRLLMEEFFHKNIMFQTRDRIPNLYDHWTVKDIRTYIRLAAGCRDRSDIYQIMNKPLRYLSRDAFQDSQVAFEVVEEYYKDKPWMLERVEKLEQDLRLISQMSPYAAINYIRKGVGYDDYVVSFCEEHEIGKEELLSILDEFQNASKGYKSFVEFNNHIKQMEEKLNEINRKKKADYTDAVTFSTIHSSKGLEFKNVFILDVNEGNIPYKKAIMDEDIEEERRLLYVGMTRAKDNLILCSVNSLNKSESKVSRFIDDIKIKQ